MSLPFDPKAEAVGVCRKLQNSLNYDLTLAVFIDRHGMVVRTQLSTAQFAKYSALAAANAKTVMVGVYSFSSSPADIEADLYVSAEVWLGL